MSQDKEKHDGVQKEDVFFRYYSESQSEVYTYILTLVPSAAEADDIFQETSSVMWRKFEQFKQGTNFTAWGCRIAYYVIVEHRRKKFNSPIRYSSETLKLLAESYTKYQKDKRSRIDQLLDCLQNLSDNERFLVQLRYNQALPIKSIAEKVGKSINMIYKSLAKVHYFLLECIQRNLAAGDR